MIHWIYISSTVYRIGEFAKSLIMDLKIVKRNNPTLEDLIEDLKRVYIKIGKEKLSIKDYDLHGKYSSSTVSRKFGTWNKALNIAGISLCNQFYSDEDFMINLRDVWLKLGKQPTRRDMDKRELSSITSTAYLRKFGTWYKALDIFSKYISANDDDMLLVGDAESLIKHKTKREPNDRLKVRVLMRDGNRCQICGVKCNDGIHKIHFDHIIPWSKGGETTLDNLRVLCADCNLALGNDNE